MFSLKTTPYILQPILLQVIFPEGLSDSKVHVHFNTKVSVKSATCVKRYRYIMHTLKTT